MFLFFSPFSFLYFSFYLLLLLSLFTINNFYYFWILMEVMMLFFMGLSYTLFVSSYSQLMMYFLIQAISSFFIFVSYLLDIQLMLTVSILMKLSMFPFFMWYVNLVYRFPNFIFLLASTLHKIPVMLMISLFFSLNSELLWVSMVLTVFVSGIMMLMITDFRMILVISSIGNNSWFVLGQMVDIYIFMIYILFYFLSLFFLLNSFSSLSKPLNFSIVPFYFYSFSFWVLSLSGMPPFFMFYVKMLLIYVYMCYMGFNFMFFVFLLFSSFMFMAYVQCLMKYLLYCYSSFSSYYMSF